MKYLIFIPLFTGCSYFYHVSEITLCVQSKPGFECRGPNGSVSICDTKEECNKICEGYNSNK